MSFAAAAIAASNSTLGRNDSMSLGDMPKMPWVWVCDQRAPGQPRKLPVPKYFQHGNEHAGKLTWESTKRWLSRGVERQVTSIWIAVEKPGHAEWSLDEVPTQLDISPFKDGTLVVVCCGNESLNPNLVALLPAPARLRTRLSDAAASLKMWKSAKSRMMATMALSRAASVFSKRNSDQSDESSLWTRETQSDLQAMRERSAQENSGVGSVTLKSAIKKDASKKKLRFDIEGGEDAQQHVMEILPPVSADTQAADFNKPKTPRLLYATDAEPCGDNALSRGTQTEPVTKANAKRCFRCRPCGKWVEEEEETDA